MLLATGLQQPRLRAQQQELGASWPPLLLPVRISPIGALLTNEFVCVRFTQAENSTKGALLTVFTMMPPWGGPCSTRRPPVHAASSALACLGPQIITSCSTATEGTLQQAPHLPL